ncbi:rhomboid family intramembrane serine protease [Bartonella tamiae]|uniref:Peptidase S54 rhomboid domain-containing protein n=1 Tax=Bartonella tamiae Th239 TaxID=1094558 RepID=J0QXG9_9HYPH|nr:rhomboid family intramembrane serine protease [Bartonella tamiae]EJF90751.1 hypothetical protein ME5_01152 [Bartonella tamiae Th239]EJF93872.1 hypothetical protein MEG_00730 [Bartonella tamiae Th307]
MNDDDYNDLLERKAPLFNIPVIVIAITLCCFFVYFIPEYFLFVENYKEFLYSYAFIPYRFIHDVWGSWYSLLSYSVMHGSLTHLVVNMLWLIVFGSPLANRLGTLRFLLFWCISSAFSVGFYVIFYIHSMIPLVGASGVVSAMTGAAGRYGFRRVEKPGYENRPEFAGPILTIKNALSSRTVLTFIGVWLLINVVIGLGGLSFQKDANNIAWEAHIGGLIFGFFFIGVFDQRKDEKY